MHLQWPPRLGPLPLRIAPAEVCNGLEIFCARSRNNRAAMAWTMGTPVRLGDWSVGEVLPWRPSFCRVSHSQHGPGSIATAQMTCDYSRALRSSTGGPLPWSLITALCLT